MGGLTISLSDLIIMQWLLVRYAPPGGIQLVNSTLLGVFILIGRIIEGVSFAVVANWSDQCRSKQGRRIPFMRWVIVPFAVVFVFLFNPPIDHLHWINEVYSGFLILLYFSMYGAVVVPYAALIPELTSDLKERVDLTTWQSIFVLVSTLLFGAVGPLLKQFGWPLIIGTAGLLGVLFFLPACLSLEEKPIRNDVANKVERIGLTTSVLLSLKNVPFVFTLISMGIFWFALSGLTSLVPYWVVSYLGGTEDDVAKIMLPYLVVSFVSFIVINKTAPRFGKHRTMLVGYFSAGVLFASLALTGFVSSISDFMFTQIIVALCGVPVAIFTVLAFPLLADIVDYDEKLTGRRREAIFFGVKGVFQKLLIGVSVLTFTLVANSSGEAVANPQRLKLMAVIYGIASLSAFAVFLGYPLREHDGKVVRKTTFISWRRRRVAAEDPAREVVIRGIELTAEK
jgi:GPH family glycoside/pentoside/hexuronide:cation symporter